MLPFGWRVDTELFRRIVDLALQDGHGRYLSFFLGCGLPLVSATQKDDKIKRLTLRLQRQMP
ncbi:hypothetical protein CCR96_16320 [Halochromatium roseum]|nr:hypothetical protein [Halochromatium roseum]